MSNAFADTVLLCPKNDEESVLILQIALKAGIPTVISPQAHGSRLEREEDLENRLKKANPDAQRLIIVETPGPEREDELKRAGFDLVVIDHHRYEGLNRMKEESSLDQFLQVFGFSDEVLDELGFDPFLVRGVGMVDRGWVWELYKEGLKKEEVSRVMDYYLTLREELGGDYPAQASAAKKAWENREEHGGIFVITSDAPVRIREELSMILAKTFEVPPVTVIKEGAERISVQDTDKAVKLHEVFGGYVFGKDRCWGFAPTKEKPAPEMKDILAVLTA